MQNYLTKIIKKTLDKQSDEPRQYIGASSIGNQCLRAIWYGLHNPENKVITAKQKLTFEIGKRLESMIFCFLGKSGDIKIFSNYLCVEREFPIFRGHADGVVLDCNDVAVALIEIKTAKDSSFNIFKRKGLKAWSPEYYDQIQSYMGMSHIHKCYFFVINKDTSETMDVLIEYDDSRYQQLLAKAKMIESAVIIPPRINGSPAFYKCKMCFYHKACHEL